MYRRFLAGSSLLAVLGAPLAAQSVVGKDQDVWSWSDRVASGNWFHFASRMGDITVTQGSGDQVRVRAEKILRRGRADDIGFIVLRDGDEVTICAVYQEDDCDRDGVHTESGWRQGNSRDRNSRDRSSRDRDDNDWSDQNRAGLKVTIELPRGVKLNAGSGNGRVTVSDAGSDVIATSGNGVVQVHGAGASVKASSGNGDVTVDGAKGPVEASSGNGDVSVATSLGPVSAHSGNGSVIATMERLDRGDREPMDFVTGNGHIRVTIPSDFDADVEASTGNGEIDSDFPITVSGRLSRSHIRGTIGRGGPRLRLQSGNGTIELRKAS